MSPTERAEHLRQRLRNIVDSGTTLDPHEIADKAIADMNAAEADDALRVTLPGYVRSLFGSLRDEAFASGDKQRELTRTGKASRTRKRSAAGEFPIYVPGDGYVRLSNVTADQLELAAAHLDTQAAGLTRNATRYRTLARLMREAGAARVKDLDEDLIRKAIVG